MTYVPPKVWCVPQEWDAREPCFILCGGESLKLQANLVPKLRGRFIAVKHSVLFRPDSDVLFISGEWSPNVTNDVVPYYKGKYIVVRGRCWEGMPDHFKRVERWKEHTELSPRPTSVSGYDTGTSAINLAYHFGARTIVLLGYDMRGGHWFTGNKAFSYVVANPKQFEFDRHMGPLPGLAEDCKRKGVRVVNVSPISAVQCFERGRLEDWV